MRLRGAALHAVLPMIGKELWEQLQIVKGCIFLQTFGIITLFSASVSPKPEQGLGVLFI